MSEVKKATPVNILGTIRKLKTQYDSEVILNVKGYSFTQRDLIDLIEKYWDSKFISGDKDKGGLYRFFRNIVKFPSRIASKIIDFDTKDFRLYAEEGQSHAPVYLANKELKAWMKDQEFGYLLNRIVKNTPKYGNHLVKSVNGEVSSVRFKRMVNDPYVEFLKDSYLVIEEHDYTPADVETMRGKWNEAGIKAVLEKFEKENKSTLLISECYIYGKERDFKEGGGDKFVRGRKIVAGLDDCTYDQKGNITSDSSIELEQGIVSKLPYYEFFWEDFQGTYLRTGIVLELLEEQFDINDVAHQERKGIYWTSKRIFQTQDMMVGHNLMLDIEDGEVLRVNKEITPIQNQEKNLPAFNNQYAQIDKNRREKTMTFESVSGETMPSGTPFRLGYTQGKAAGGYFDFQREDIGLLLKKFIWDVIIPSFKSSKRTKHIFNLYGIDNELMQMEEFMIESMLYNAIQKGYETSGLVPTENDIIRERDNIKLKLRSKPNRKIEIPEGMYDELKMKMDLLITDESMALDSKSTTLTSLLQTIGTNPAILQNPVTRKILFRLAELGGVSPEELQEATGQMGPMNQGQSLNVNPAQTFSPPPAPVKGSELNMGGRSMTL